jgi:hypothetical protein
MMGALHAPHAGGKPLKASQRKLGRARPRGRPPVAATPAVGQQVRWLGRRGTVERLDGDKVVIDFDGKSWLLPVDELEPV